MQNGSGNLRVCLGEGAPAQPLQLGGDGAQARLERRAVGLVGDLLKLFADSTHSIGLLEALVSAIGLSVWKDGVVFAILIVVLRVKPTGIMGHKTTEKV